MSKSKFSKPFFSNKPAGLDDKWEKKGAILKTANVLFNIKGLEEKSISFLSKIKGFFRLYALFFKAIKQFSLYAYQTLRDLSKGKRKKTTKPNSSIVCKAQEISSIKKSFYAVLVCSLIISSLVIYFVILTKNYNPLNPSIFLSLTLNYYCWTFYKLVKRLKVGDGL